jgi:hypothetical protein
MEQFNQGYKYVVKRMEDLEKHNAQLIQTLNDILNEDDIKELPAYRLLYRTYSQFLNIQIQQAALKTEKAGPSQLYDPLHAPPNARGKKPSFGQNAGYTQSEISSTAKPESKFKDTVKDNFKGNDKAKIESAEPQHTQHYSSQMPNIDVCILSDNLPKPKIMLKKPTEAKSLAESKLAESKLAETKSREVKIKTEKTDNIYKIEIEGVVYLKHDNYLYDVSTRKRVAIIENNAFKFTCTKQEKSIGDHSEVINLHKVEGFSEYYSTEINSGAVYILINDTIAQSVGEFNEGEIQLWA